MTKYDNSTIHFFKKELDFFLIEKGEEDPWAYVEYQCGIAVNLYSKVHWTFHPKGWKSVAKQF